MEWKKNYLGDEAAGWIAEKRDWIIKTFNKEHYRFISDGFLINEYYVEFFDPAHQTLYNIKFPQ
jgi:hypothetical protein